MKQYTSPYPDAYGVPTKLDFLFLTINTFKYQLINNFNHLSTMGTTTKTSKFPSSIGMDAKEEDTIVMKFAMLTRTALVSDISPEEIHKKIKEDFSYEELLFATTLFIMQKTLDLVDNDPQLQFILKMVKNFKDMRQGDEEGMV